MSEKVRAKKHLGQHFLTDHNIAQKIANTLTLSGYNDVLEIGPGMGMLTQYLLAKEVTTHVIEIDKESVAYLEEHYPELQSRIYSQDFLASDVRDLFGERPFAITGNFPYNISSQILFKTLALRAQVPEFTGMFQKEVAARVCEGPGTKTYGILSVLTQAFYDAEYLFTVSENVFNPPPKVKSGVLRLRRKEHFRLDCDEKLFFQVVKAAFQQRRKTLRNSLKSFNLSNSLKEDAIFGQRPEQLAVHEFVKLTQKIGSDTI